MTVDFIECCPINDSFTFIMEKKLDITALIY